MKILAYCLQTQMGPPEEWLPAIPIGLLSTEGFLWKDSRAEDLAEKHKFKQIELKNPTEFADGCWLGIETDGSCTTLRSDDEPKWRITRATRALEEVQGFAKVNPGQTLDALHSVYRLHAAAALMGVRVAGLHMDLLRVRKSSNEPLEVTVRALVEELAKQK
jgi:hypothetical protein